MRIISKFKDYYDYPVKFYGIDNKVVYKRDHNTEITDQYKIPKSKKVTSNVYDYDTDRLNEYRTFYFVIAFCGNLYQGFYNHQSDDYIYNFDELPDQLKKKSWSNPTKETFVPEESNLNKLLDCPVVFFYQRRNKNDYFVSKNPVLHDLKFYKVFDAIQAYQKLSQYISYKEPEMPLSPIDLNRFESKGFDKKTSFRKL